MSKNGMSKEMYNFITDNFHKMNIDIEKGIILTPKGTNGSISTTTGYRLVKINKKTLQVHQILAVMYFGEKCIGMQVNHKDGNKLNNLKENLEVITQAENIKHEWETGLCNSNHSRKLSDEQVLDIRNNYIPNNKKSKFTTNYFSAKYDISSSVISNIINGKSYKDVFDSHHRI